MNNRRHSRYASQTTVSEDRSRSEIERILKRYGATGFMYGWTGADALIGFVAHGRQIKIILALPSLDDASKTPSGRKRYSAAVRLKAHGFATRQRWRALALVIKAKLEAIESGISTFDEEFLAWTMLPTGQTVGQAVIPQMEDAYKTGRMLPLLLTSGGAVTQEQDDI